MKRYSIQSCNSDELRASARAAVRDQQLFDGTNRRGDRVIHRFVLLAGIALVSVGCVRRTVTINTDPQGARVLLNDEEVGTSPVSVDFTWYGDYDVVLRKEGYATTKTNQRIDAPWYQVPPMDFFAEALVPFEIHDQREVTFILEPSETISREALLDEAAKTRERALFAEE